MKDRGGRINRTPRPDSSATPESEPEEAAVVAARRRVVEAITVTSDARGRAFV